MKISNIDLQMDGYVICRSSFYSAQNSLEWNDRFHFSSGVNPLIGDIDSGGWAASYTLSMFSQSGRDFVVYKRPEITINGTAVSVEEVLNISCYMDKSYSVFNKSIPVCRLVERSIRKNRLNVTTEEIRRMFAIDPERFQRPLTGTGNERFKAMAAIGYCCKKEIYCFPWMSERLFKSFHYNLTWLLGRLAELEKVVILPVGFSESGSNGSDSDFVSMQELTSQEYLAKVLKRISSNTNDNGCQCIQHQKETKRNGVWI